MPSKPPLSLPATAPTPAIAAEINHAIREQHDRLNRLIIERIPFALPPHATNLEFYGRGLTMFARIYYAFESAAHEISMSNGDLDMNTFFILNSLYVKGLRRSTRLGSDLTHICKVTRVDVRRTLQAEQDQMAERIRRDLVAKPHLLVAYTWVMYMAIFSGGRWIRKQLLNAGHDFWVGQDDPEDTEKYDDTAHPPPGFTFLSFDGGQDGQDIKSAFNAQLAATERLLTEKEREEIVEVAQDILDDCIALVGMLDHTMQQLLLRKRRSHWVWLCIGVVVLLLVYLYFATVQ